MAGKSGKFKILVIWLVLIGLFCVLYAVHIEPTAQPISFGQFCGLVSAGGVDQVWMDRDKIVFQARGSEQRMSTSGIIDGVLTKKLDDDGVSIQYGKPPSERLLGDWTAPIVTIVVVVAALFLFLRLFAKRREGMYSGVFSLRKTRAVLIDDHRKVTFADVGGCEEAKRSLTDVVDFLRNPKRWTDAGARLPRGVLLDGPPGCGKTLLARAVAGETNAKFYVVSASEFVELFVGVGAARVRDTFEIAAKDAPAIIFIDELDAIGRRRGSGVGLSHEEREQTLNQLLVNLDGIKTNDRVVVLAATNRPEILDKALLRPGRFDRILHVPELSHAARLAVLQIHSRNKPLGKDISLAQLADCTSGLSGAQLESLVNEAALLAVRRGRDTSSESVEVLQGDFLAALESVRPGRPDCDNLDEVLIESASQLAKPAGKALARLTLVDGGIIEGEVLWVNAAFIKIRGPDDESATLVPKRQIARLEAMEGAEQAELLEAAAGSWANRLPGAI